jgi:hypothetical protein
VALGSYGAALTLGCIRLPLRGTKWTDSQEKLKFCRKLAFFMLFHRFSALSGSLFPTNQNRQVAYAAAHKPFVCLCVPLWFKGFLDGV